MAKTQQKDILSRVQDIGAEMLNKLPDMPGGAKVLEMANESKARIDELQKRMRGLDALEKRVEKIERQLAKQSAQSKSSSPATPQAKKPAAAKPATPKKPPA